MKAEGKYLNTAPDTILCTAKKSENPIMNITDVSLMVNYILSHATDHFYFPNADIDGSNTVNITDVTLVINIILNPGG